MKTIYVPDRVYRKNVIRARQLNKLHNLYMRYMREGDDEKRSRVWAIDRKISSKMAATAWVLFDVAEL